MHGGLPFVALILLAVAALIFLRLVQTLQGGSKQSDYRQKALLTPNEVEFYNRLKAAFPDHVILPQVSMAALMEPTASDRKARTAALNRITSKRVEYVVANRHELSAIVLIELDDKTHKAARDEARDALTRSTSPTPAPRREGPCGEFRDWR